MTSFITLILQTSHEHYKKILFLENNYLCENSRCSFIVCINYLCDKYKYTLTPDYYEIHYIKTISYIGYQFDIILT